MIRRSRTHKAIEDTKIGVPGHAFIWRSRSCSPGRCWSISSIMVLYSIGASFGLRATMVLRRARVNHVGREFEEGLSDERLSPRDQKR